MRMVQLTKQEKENILENLLKRSPNQYDEYQEAVNEILENVKKEGDKAVFDYTKRFDKADISKETLYVTEEEIKEAYSLVDDDLIETMKKSIANIRDFHERQVRNSWFHTREDGVILGPVSYTHLDVYKRQAKYLHKLTKNTQFIVITHRKGTMEAADVLYGITMQEKGVSTLVSVKLIEEQLDN